MYKAKAAKGRIPIEHVYKTSNHGINENFHFYANFSERHPHGEQEDAEGESRERERFFSFFTVFLSSL